MSIAVTVDFQGVSPSEALRADIEQHAVKLGKFAGQLQTCDAVVGLDQGRHRKGNQFQVRLTATLPGGVETVERHHEDAHMAAHQAFRALRRQLEDFIRIRRGY